MQEMSFQRPKVQTFSGGAWTRIKDCVVTLASWATSTVPYDLVLFNWALALQVIQTKKLYQT